MMVNVIVDTFHALVVTAYISDYSLDRNVDPSLPCLHC
jgi:hypothetical protein